MNDKNIPLKYFSDYFFENISCGYPNQIQITSLCNAKCIFCSNEQNPFKIERYKFRDLSEIKKVIWANDFMDGDIALNESLPGRISEGEAFLHPQFFDILYEIRKKFLNNIIISTNGSLLTEKFITELSKYNPINITISLPSINKSNWMETFRLSEENFNNAFNSFDLLRRYNIGLRASMVPMPSWFGWDDIENTISFLSQKISNIIIYSPGFTRHTDKEVIDKLVFDKREMADFLDLMSIKYKIAIDWTLHPDIALEDIDINIFKNLLLSTYERKHKSLWLTSEASYDRFKILMSEISKGIPADYDILKINNHTYGGNIECSGLWTLDDIRRDLNELLTTYKPDVIFMNGNFLDKYGFDLLGNNIVDFIDEYHDIYFHVFKKV